MSFTIESADPPLSNPYRIQLYAYEPFSYRFVYSAGATSNASPFSNSSVLNKAYLTADTSGIWFRNTDSGYDLPASAQGETLTLVDSCNVVYSNTVFASAGRFTSLNSNFVLYANEPFSSVRFITRANMDPATAFTQPTLPANMIFRGRPGDSNTFDLSGYPAASTTPTSYLLVASNANSQIVSTSISIQIKPERIQLFGQPASTTLLTVGSKISDISFSLTVPSTTTRPPVYTLPALPSGLNFVDWQSNIVTSSFSPTDPSGILVITGTPTIDTPTAIGYYGSNSIVSTIAVTAYGYGNIVLSNSAAVSFAYTPTVIFTRPTNNSSLPTLTVGLAIPTNNVSYNFQAQSLFGGSQSIVDIYSTDLTAARTDISMSFLDASRGSVVRGTPVFSNVGSAVYTATAIDTSGNTGQINFRVSTVADVVGISSFLDTCMNFIIGRPVSNPLPGYYSGSLTLTASSSANQPLVFSYPDFTSAGLTPTSTSNSLTLSGTPTTLIAQKTATVYVSDGLPNGTASTTVGFAVLDDVFTWETFTFAFQQNRTIAPVQLSATTLSGLLITSYTVAGLPVGLSCTRNGLIHGTCTAGIGGSFVVTATTGLSTQTRTYVYTITPDDMLVTTPSSAYSLPPGAVIPAIPITAFAYSGGQVTSFSLEQPSYGLTIDSMAGAIRGTLYSGDPGANQQLYPYSVIHMTAVVGSTPVSADITLASTMVLKNLQVAIGNNQVSPMYTDLSGMLLVNPEIVNAISGSPLANPYGDTPMFNAGDIQLVSSNVVVGSLSGLGSNGSVLFGDVVYGNPPATVSLTTPTRYRSAYSVAYSGSGSTWYALGQGINRGSNDGHVFLHQSDDNGQTWTPGYTSTTTSNWGLAVRSGFEESNTTRNFSDFFVSTIDATGSNRGGVVLRRSPSGIYMAGGGRLDGRGSTIRITSMSTPGQPGDLATIVPTWGYVNCFGSETRDFALGNAAIWVAAGSSFYGAYDPQPPFTVTTTLKWSSDAGASWSNATSQSDFTHSATVVVYGGARFLAIGRNLSSPESSLKTSTTGKFWTSVSFPVDLNASSTIAFANSRWYVNVDGTNIYMNNSSLSSVWTVIASPIAGISKLSTTATELNPVGSNSTLTVSYRRPQILMVSPTLTTYSVLQYTNIAPITVTMNSPCHLFVDDATLPRGLVFDTQSSIFSGMPVLTGTTVVRLYATPDGVHYNYFDFTFMVTSPYPQKRQDTASAYTAYVRQEAVIGGAQFSRDANALPSEHTTVGAAMGPAPPAVETAPEPCCS